MAPANSTTTSDATNAEIQLFLAAFRSITGTIDYNTMGEIMGITGSAAGKRLKRHFEKLDPQIVLSGTTLGKAADGTTPKTPRGRKPAIKNDINNDADHNDPQTPTSTKVKRKAISVVDEEAIGEAGVETPIKPSPATKTAAASPKKRKVKSTPVVKDDVDDEDHKDDDEV